MMTGSMGYGRVESMTAKLVEQTGEDTHLYILGGTNEELKKTLRDTYADTERVHVLDFTTEAHLYMAAADILFTKPGGLTSTEAVAAKVALVHTKPIPGCEDRNVAFFTQHGMSVSGDTEDAVIQNGLKLLRDPEAQAEMRKCQENTESLTQQMQSVNSSADKGSSTRGSLDTEENDRQERQMIIRELGMTVFGLLCGSILFGRALPKWIKGIDVTEVSNDHNPGTANAMKYAGVPVGILCLLGDLLKGALPVYVAVGMGLVTDSWFPLIMVAPVLGHAYSLFYHGNGGKAIAVSFGVLIGLAPVQPELLLLLIILYLSGSALLIRPHTKRTRITYICFAVGAAVLLMIQRIPRQVFGGALLISAIVIHKNSIRQEILEEATESLESL